MRKTPDRLDSIVTHLMQSLGLGKTYYGWQMVERWPEIVGMDIARVARAERFADGILTIIVEKDTWRQELEMQLDSILEKIRAVPGGSAVDRIVLRAGSIREKDNGIKRD